MSEEKLIFDLKAAARNNAAPQPMAQTTSATTTTPTPTTASPISEEINQVLTDYESYLSSKRVVDEEKVKFSQSLSIAAFFYEKARNVVDNKSDHLLRRNAIERIIRRLIWEHPRAESAKIAEGLARELVWGRYLDNGSVTRKQIEKTAKILDKYFFLINATIENPGGNAEKRKQVLFGMMSVEIELTFDQSLFYIGSWTRAMKNWFLKVTDWEDTDFSMDQKETLVYIAVHRALTKSDDARIFFHYTTWKLKGFSSITEDNFPQMKEELFSIIDDLGILIDSPALPRLYRMMRRNTAQFLIAKDIVEKNPATARGTFVDRDKLVQDVVKTCTLRYNEISGKIRSGITRSIIYILLTKIFIIMAVEVPFEIFYIGAISWYSLGINLLTPPILMVLVGLSIRKPDSKNTERILEKIKRLAYEKEPTQKIRFSVIQKKEEGMGYQIFSFIYLLFFLTTFAIIVFILTLLQFNIVSMIVFFFFLSLVLLFGFRVQFAASDLLVDPDNKNFVSKLFENFTLPFLNLGVWLSKGMVRLNFLTVFMDILIEMPLKTLIEIAGEWTNFIKEKRAEMVEVPM
jgi:hypothetical protein